MKNNDSGPVIAIIAVIAVIIIGAGIASAASNNTKTKSTTNYTSAPSSTSYTPSYNWGFDEDEDEEGEEEVWTCRDATSYDRNSSNDNHCTSNKGGDRYVDDCTAVKLDPTYHPSQRGASYYNGCAW